MPQNGGYKEHGLSGVNGSWRLFGGVLMWEFTSARSRASQEMNFPARVGHHMLLSFYKRELTGSWMISEQTAGGKDYSLELNI